MSEKILTSQAEIANLAAHLTNPISMKNACRSFPTYLRLAAVGSLLIAGIAIGSIALKNSSPPSLGKSERPRHAMSPAAVRLASPETVADVQSGAAGPQYSL